jgi:hypothetical protein
MRFFLRHLTLTKDKGGVEAYVAGAAVNSAGARLRAVPEPTRRRRACTGTKALGRVAIGVGHPGPLASGPCLFKNFPIFFPMISIAPTSKIPKHVLPDVRNLPNFCRAAV